MKVMPKQVRIGDTVSSSEVSGYRQADRVVTKIRHWGRSQVKYTLSSGHTLHVFPDRPIQLEFLEEPADVSERQMRASQVRRGDRLASGQVFARGGGIVRKVKHKKDHSALTLADKTTADLFSDTIVIIER